MADVTHRFIFSSLRPTKRLRFPETDTCRVFHTSIKLEVPTDVLNLEYCERLMVILMDCQDLADFRRRVDPDRDKVPDYYNVVKKPMDLGKLQDSLARGQVSTVGEFKRDLDLIWDNCIQYNGPKHALSMKAQEAKNIIEDAWNRSEQPDTKRVVQSVLDIQSILQNWHSKCPKLLALEPRPVIPRAKKPQKNIVREKEPELVKPKPVDVVPNRDQRQSIAEKLSKAPVDEMRVAWNILKPFLDKDAQTRQSFSLNDLPDDILIELKKAVPV